MSLNSDPGFDPIGALESLGYTDREAAFLYLVAVHSGYFVRRQFDYFTDRNKGSIVMRFLRKARAQGHVESLEYKQGWHVYHLCSRSIYRLVGDPDSQLRRRKGDPHVRARLMALDYVLENDAHHFIESEADRVRFFRQDRHIAKEMLIDDNMRVHSLLASFPISIADRAKPALSPVRFAFIDEGLLSIEKFLRFLSTAGPLLSAIGNFELVYVALSSFHFEAAKAAFWSRFGKVASVNSTLFEDDLRPVAMQSRSLLHPRFTTLLLGYSYPILQRSERKGSEGVRNGREEEDATVGIRRS